MARRAFRVSAPVRVASNQEQRRADIVKGGVKPDDWGGLLRQLRDRAGVAMRPMSANQSEL